LNQNPDLIKEKSYQAALKMAQLYIHLCEQKEFEHSKQLLRTGARTVAKFEYGKVRCRKRCFPQLASIKYQYGWSMGRLKEI